MDILLQIIGGIAICGVGVVLFFGGCLGNNAPLAIAGIATLVGGIFGSLTVIMLSFGIELTMATLTFNSAVSLATVGGGYYLMFRRRRNGHN